MPQPGGWDVAFSKDRIWGGLTGSLIVIVSSENLHVRHRSTSPTGILWKVQEVWGRDKPVFQPSWKTPRLLLRPRSRVRLRTTDSGGGLTGNTRCCEGRQGCFCFRFFYRYWWDILFWKKKKKRLILLSNVEKKSVGGICGSFPCTFLHIFRCTVLCCKKVYELPSFLYVLH